jgi:hypothetical protein
MLALDRRHPIVQSDAVPDVLVAKHVDEPGRQQRRIAQLDRKRGVGRKRARQCGQEASQRRDPCSRVRQHVRRHRRHLEQQGAERRSQP